MLSAHAEPSTPEQVCDELRRCAGTQCDPVDVQALCDVLCELPADALVSVPQSAGPSAA